LQEALQRARLHYKQPMLELNGWGSRRLPVESRLIGGGSYAPAGMRGIGTAFR
jgi:hypothetical protein